MCWVIISIFVDQMACHKFKKLFLNDIGVFELELVTVGEQCSVREWTIAERCNPEVNDKIEWVKPMNNTS